MNYREKQALLNAQKDILDIRDEVNALGREIESMRQWIEEAKKKRGPGRPRKVKTEES